MASNGPVSPGDGNKVRRLAGRLGTAKMTVSGKRFVWHFLDDGRATCGHVADGTPYALVGTMEFPGKGRFPTEICADCVERYWKKKGR